MAKRKIEIVDLTGDDDVISSHRSKSSRLDAPLSSSSGRGSSQFKSSYPTPPTSSQLSSTQGASGHYVSVHGNTSQNRVIGNGWSGSTEESEADIRREIDLTNDFDDDVYEDYELYGILNAKIVGIRYYDGRASTGEYVRVRRESSNPYDTNAIRIDNVVGNQIGHLGREVAAKLARLMDNKSLLIEGALTGPKEHFTAPVGLKLFGPRDPVAAAALKQTMQELRLPVKELVRADAERKKRAKILEQQQKAREKAAAAMRKNGGTVFDIEGSNRYANLSMSGSTSSPVPNMDELLSGTATFNPREIQDVVNKFASAEDILSKMEMAEQPLKLSTPLLPYQRQGLKWMLDHESPKLPAQGSEDVVQLWKSVHGGVYQNIATSFAVTKAPELASGGILADDMGLGKTLQVISLIMADPHKTRKPTLIICPVSVMSNWSTQAATHIKKQHAPRVLVYHGQEKRGLLPQEFEEYDIVVTTYATMTHELYGFGKSTPESVPTRNGLFSLTWRRIVLDEGHQIRNPKAKMSQAACALLAKSRWVLTGTPIVNSLKDLYSHVKFLRMSGGLAELEIFNSTLIRPLKAGEEGARLLLQALMSTICLRRMKDMKFIDLKLPSLEFHKYTIKFAPHEQERYDAFKAEARGLVEAARVKKGDNTMSHLLEVLLRLRQTCNHWKLCGEERVNKLLEMIEGNKAVDIMDPASRQALQDLLQLRIDSQEECPICIDVLKEPLITGCGHAFCSTCISRVIETQQKCPMCRQPLADNTNLVAPAAAIGEGDSGNAIDINADDAMSSKIEALIKILMASSRDKTTSKTVVFSQFTSFLDLVQTQLDKRGLIYTRLDGRMTALRRDMAIESLNNDPSCKIMLASLAVCSVGLNLVAANQVILSDSWWAPSIEDQAVDRVHRLGQTRDCKVVRLVIEDTIEDEVLEIQAKKRKLAGMAFGEKDAGKKREERSQRLRDIERLLR